jgi:hypothetical protein
VVAGHTSQSDWAPDIAIALFTRIKDPSKLDWVVQMDYFIDEIVWFNTKKYKCVIGHTSQPDWAPGMCGLWVLL